MSSHHGVTNLDHVESKFSAVIAYTTPMALGAKVTTTPPPLIEFSGVVYKNIGGNMIKRSRLE